MVDKEVESSHSEEESEQEDLNLDSDEELQEAFAAGLIKPGLNTVLAPKETKQKTNNIDGLKQKLAELKQDLPWIEKLDMVNKPAPLAPELAYQEEQHAKRREKLLKNAKNTTLLSDDPVHNDFKREMLFYRQAQATVIESLSRFKNMGLPTKRPEDYFAQMFKSDDHMQKNSHEIGAKTGRGRARRESAEIERFEKIRETGADSSAAKTTKREKRHARTSQEISQRENG